MRQSEYIQLFGLTGCVGALLFDAPTGVTYTNQVGGYACHHPKIEGYCIPIQIDKRSLDLIFVSKLGPFQGHCCNGITKEQAEYLNEYLPARVQIDPNRIERAEEAWLPIVYGGKPGILTWENSD